MSKQHNRPTIVLSRAYHPPFDPSSIESLATALSRSTATISTPPSSSAGCRNHSVLADRVNDRDCNTVCVQRWSNSHKRRPTTEKSSRASLCVINVSYLTRTEESPHLSSNDAASPVARLGAGSTTHATSHSVAPSLLQSSNFRDRSSGTLCPSGKSNRHSS